MITMKYIFCCVLLLAVQRCHSSFEQDMQALEKDLRDEEMRRSKADGAEHFHEQKKSIASSNSDPSSENKEQNMTTEELIEELKKDEANTKKAKTATERFHDITKTSSSTDDFEKLLRGSVNNALDKKVVEKHEESSSQKKSVESTQKQKSDHTTNKASTQILKIKTTQKDEDKDTKLLRKALATIQELRDAELQDVQIQKKGLAMLKELMITDKESLEKRNSATKETEAKETARFKAALTADSANMKKLVGEKNTKKEKTEKEEKKVSTKGMKEMKSNKVEDEKAKDGLMDDLLQLMADDLVKKIADEMSRDQKLSKKEEASSNDTCADKRTDCAQLEKYCESNHRNRLRRICRKTCGFCSKPCADVWLGIEAHRCEIIFNANRCHETDVDKYCARSCGYCRMPAPPKCSKTQYGCCWDKETAKMDKVGSNCHACDDQYVYVCKRFNVECGNTNMAGTFMRKHCPKTCQVCSDECRDDPGKAFYCPFWKKDLNWCNARPEIMRHFCPVTCQLC